MPVLLIVAILVVPLLHTPPVIASVNDVVALTHTFEMPVIVPAKGNGLTVAVTVAATEPQLLLTKYDIVVVPADRPLTKPVLLTVAILVVPLLHTPPVVASVNDVVAPAHTVDAPVIIPAMGNGLMLTVAVATAIPQAVETT